MPCSRSRRSRAGQRGVVGGDHAALAGGDQLAGVERPGREQRAGPDRAAVVGGSGGAGGVLDHGDAPRSQRRARASTSAGTPPWWTTMTALVRGGAAPPRPSPAVRLPVARSTSAKTGSAPHVADRVGGGDERERRDDDLVARPDARARQRQVQAGGARRHGDAVRGADPAANAASNSATRGPWATQPERTASAAACGLLLAEHRAPSPGWWPGRCAARGSGSAPRRARCMPRRPARAARQRPTAARGHLAHRRRTRRRRPG